MTGPGGAPRARPTSPTWPVTERAHAEALDRADPLFGFRDRFVIADPALCYLDGNSLGRLPKATAERLATLIADEWGAGLVRSWGSWIDLPAQVGDRLGEAVVGADPGQVLIIDSTTINLHRLATAALDTRPGGGVALTHSEFPTDRYVLQGVSAAMARPLRLLDAAGHDEVDEACSSGEVGLVCLSHVDFRTAAVADLEAITAAAHRHGALVLWDLSHSAGAVPVGLDDAGVDFAVGCTYKYLNAGPGAPGWLYVRRDLQESLRPPVWGWFAQQDQFTMGPDFCPAPGIKGWLTGTPNVAGLASVEEGVALVAEAGMPAIRAKSEALTAMAVALYDAWLAPLGFGLPTPRDARLRGGHVAVQHAEAWRLCRVLAEGCGVVTDHRPPDLVRLGLSPLTTRFAEAWDAMDRLRRAFTDQLYLGADPTPARVT